MMSETESARSFWNREVITPTNSSWMANLAVRHYINTSISGDPGVWPVDWFARVCEGRRFLRGLSIGCGTGALERDFLHRELCEHIDAFDASDVSLSLAREQAQREGLADRTNYFAADFNTVVLPKSQYDLILFHQSLHHVSRLERLLQQVTRALAPNGLVYLDEFVGPSRTYWAEREIAAYRAIYQFLPRSIRYFDEFAMPIQYDDLSEAVRSGEIESRLRIGFEIEHFRGYGGNLLAMLFPDVNVALLTDDQVEMMIRAERSMLASGAPHFHAVIVARPKVGLSRLNAVIRYFLSPKLRRLVREVRKVYQRQVPAAAAEEDRFRL